MGNAQPELTPVVSSNIAAANYDADTQVLRVRFNSGAEYDYADVPETVGQQFFEAESVGRFFNQAIRYVYSYVQTADVVPVSDEEEAEIDESVAEGTDGE